MRDRDTTHDYYANDTWTCPLRRMNKARPHCELNKGPDASRASPSIDHTRLVAFWHLMLSL
jgi:hypothetical protein